MRLRTLTFILALVVRDAIALSSPLKPFTNYTYSTSLKDKVGDLWWTVDAARKEITFEMHIKTTGWIALGISPGLSFSLVSLSPSLVTLFEAGGMKGADIGLGWVDQAGKLYFEVSLSAGNSR
jgi:hypothetical protein